MKRAHIVMSTSSSEALPPLPPSTPLSDSEFDDAVKKLPFALTPLEAEIFAILRAASSRTPLLPSHTPPRDGAEDSTVISGDSRPFPPPFPSPVIRIAGGWVRDKLLGKENDDIDIALDNCKGMDFARVVGGVLRDREGVNNGGKIAVIGANPDQSKHLETATMRVLGLPLDFVNLRSESYSSSSRIPTVSFGTATSDAMRRDFTVNSLFFNVSNCTVEDLTGKGIEDLREGVMRTPLEPLVTFLDDPLRVLRMIRFSARFGFDIHPPLIEAAKDESVHEALGEKVSRERIGTELEGMFTGRDADPSRALRTMERCGLLEVVYRLPDVDAEGGGEGTGRESEKLKWREGFEGAMRVSGVVGEDSRIDERLLYLLTLLRGFRGEKHPDKKIKLVTSYVIRESLKWKNSDVDTVATVLEVLEDVGEVVGEVSEGDLRNWGDCRVREMRVKVGMLLRTLKSMWITAVALSIIHRNLVGTDAFHKFMNFTEVTLELRDIWKVKSKIGGKEIVGVLGVKKGPQVGVYSNEAVKFELRYPEKGKDEVLDFLRHFKE